MVLEDDIACVFGIKIVTDYEGVTMSHFVQGTPSMLRKMVAVSQVCMQANLDCKISKIRLKLLSIELPCNLSPKFDIRNSETDLENYC